MTRGRRGESGPYVGPDRPARLPAAGHAAEPAGRIPPPFVAAAPPSISFPSRPSARQDHSGAARPGVATVAYEEWGPPPSAAVGVRPGNPPLPLPLPPTSEVVADALETIALRVRTGELVPLGFEPGMGDAAAVATALTALLAGER